MPYFSINMKKPELLAPAGDWISLKAALQSKADAIYFGVSGFNMRAGTVNFQIKDLPKIANLCHSNNTKAYLAINIIIYQTELEKIKKIISAAKKANIDAVIAWDFSVLKECKKQGMRIHLSTQASVSNFESAKYYYEHFGIKRIILARECTLDDIEKILKQIKKEKIDLEIETFAHGAMCVSISGRCYMSQFLFNKSANRGECIQPCRRGYIAKDPEETHELELSNNFVMSPKDLCTMPFLDQLIDAGINSFKIEGRNRSPEYVRTVVDCYRRFIDFYCAKKQSKKELQDLKKELIEKMQTVYNRGFSDGFFMGRPIAEWTDSYGSKAITKKSYIGKVINFFPKANAAEILIESGKLNIKDRIMIQGVTTGVFEQEIMSMQLSNSQISEAKKGMRVAILLNEKVRKNDKVYLISSL